MDSLDTEFWQDVYTILGLTAAVILILSMPILRLTLDRRVRKALPPDKIYISFMDANFGVGRAISFGLACLFDYANNSQKLRYHYNNLDVRSIATRFDKFIAYCMVISGGIITVMVPFHLITEYFGFFVWPEPVEY